MENRVSEELWVNPAERRRKSQPILRRNEVAFLMLAAPEADVRQPGRGSASFGGFGAQASQRPLELGRIANSGENRF